MTDDHLSNDTSISFELTDTGVKAAAKSRAVAAFDRLVGNVADLGNAWVEGATTRRRAKNEGERQIIEAAAKYGVGLMQADDAFAGRAFDNHFRKIARQQLNKDAVVAEAVEDLRTNPPSDEDAAAGPEEVSEEFIGRFETYAEGATTKQLRERWGRILAGEIRNPGTFSPKVLRATDELDAVTAAIFESLMPYRVRDVLVKSTMPKLPLTQTLALISAGLIVDPGLNGHRNTFGEGAFNNVPYWAAQFNQVFVAFPKAASVPRNASNILSHTEGGPAFGVIILTDVGKALSSILPSDENSLASLYADKLATVIPREEISLWMEVQPGELIPLKSPFT